MSSKKQKSFGNEKAVLDELEAVMAKASAKFQASADEERKANALFLQAGQFEHAVVNSKERVPCPACGGKKRDKFDTANFCEVCRALGWVNREALVCYAAGVRQQAKEHLEESERLARSARRLLEKKTPKLKQALAQVRTPSFGFAPDLPVVIDS